MSALELVRIGIVGSGLMARRHLESLRGMADAKVVAFCDVVPARAEEMGQQYGAMAFTEPERMVDESELDVVYILLPSFAHGRAEMAAIQRRIPLFVEKPIGNDLGLCREIAAAVAEANLLTSVGYQNRYRKAVQRVRQVLQPDPAVLAYGGWITGLPLAPEHLSTRAWTLQRAKTGGRFAETGGHTVDLARYLMGEVVEFFAYSAPPRTFSRNVPEIYDLDDVEVVSLRFASGAIAAIFATVAANDSGGVSLNLFAGRHSACFSGSEHSLRLTSLDDAGRQTVETIPGEPPLWEDWDRWRRTGQRTETEGVSEPDIFDIENRAFLEAVKTGNQDLVKTSYADALKTSEITLGIQRSIDTGKPVYLK